MADMHTADKRPTDKRVADQQSNTIKVPADVWNELLKFAAPVVTVAVTIESDCYGAPGDRLYEAWHNTSMSIIVEYPLMGFEARADLDDIHNFAKEEWEQVLEGGESMSRAFSMNNEGRFVRIKSSRADDVMRTTLASIRLPREWVAGPIRAALRDTEEKGVKFIPLSEYY